MPRTGHKIQRGMRKSQGAKNPLPFFGKKHLMAAMTEQILAKQFEGPGDRPMISRPMFMTDRFCPRQHRLGAVHSALGRERGQRGLIKGSRSNLQLESSCQPASLD